MKLTSLVLVATAIVAVSGPPDDIPADMAKVEGGTYVPMFGERDKPRTVAPFLLDRRPVTNGEFLAFVREHPEWKRSSAKRLFADDGYLSHWEADEVLGDKAPENAPVIRVSWFAARAYLKACGKRLPREDEWEFAALADAERGDASKDPAFLKKILEWYAKPTPAVLPSVSDLPADLRGIQGLHGCVWEWVEDFNNQMVTGAARSDSTLDRSLFCAGGAVSATDAANYAAFMRYAFRSSLEGNYTVNNLGFRGARSIP
ncbi:formylglycine-generating enzyme family protein [Haloferula rosea]|uniref:Formylglycine-generating enzyme family protein n=1 Tax=Haloferula rosea TaxID=490093 RepID=A0A934VH71_9BACT|nr:formylglycine-generating enzyme family protein [Haloferula rosea]MBK1828767.1 formylglycine-generating enzyme family protein [Haloferula rosea]